MIKPISPKDIAPPKIPDCVIEIINDLIVKNYKHDLNKAILYQEDVVNIISAKLGILRQTVFDSGYLNFEDVYRASGWKVLYDKPAYNESYNAFFQFTPKG